MGKNKEEDANGRCGGAAPGPDDLAGHEAAGQDVDALKDPDDAQGDHEAGEDLEEGADGVGHDGFRVRLNTMLSLRECIHANL